MEGPPIRRCAPYNEMMSGSDSHEPLAPAPAEAPEIVHDPDAPVWDRVAAIIDRIRPAVQSDGGDLELVEVTDGVVTVRFHGACVGCPSSTMTLQTGIENNLRMYVPEVREVRAIE